MSSLEKDPRPSLLERTIEGQLWRPLQEFGVGPSVAHALAVYDVDTTDLYQWPGGTAEDPDQNLVRRSRQLTFERYVLHLPWEKNPIPSNGSRGNHWAHAARVRAARSTAYYLARQLDPKLLGGRVRVELVWHVVTKRGRDAPNLMLVLKALIDGLRIDPRHQQPRGIIQDDTPEYIDVLMPRIEYAPRSPENPRAYMTLTIWPWPV